MPALYIYEYYWLFDEFLCFLFFRSCCRQKKKKCKGQFVCVFHLIHMDYIYDVLSQVLQTLNGWTKMKRDY